MKEKRLNRIATVIFIIVILSVAIYNTRKGDKEAAAIYKENPLIKVEDSIQGNVSYKFDFKANRLRDFSSVSLLVINDNKCSIIADEAYGPRKPGINDVISVGDSVLKKSNNDTINILKKDGRKYVLLRRDKLVPNGD